MSRDAFEFSRHKCLTIGMLIIIIIIIIIMLTFLMRLLLQNKNIGAVQKYK